MGRPPFTPTEAEAQAIRCAESAWRRFNSLPEERQILDLTPLTELKKAVHDMQDALQSFMGEGVDARLRNAFVMRLAIQQGHLPHDALQGLNVMLARLSLLCEQWAPPPGVSANPRERSFILQAADVWVVAVGAWPTSGGRFQKTIAEVTAEPLCKITRDRIETGLKAWRASIEHSAFRASITAELPTRE